MQNAIIQKLAHIGFSEKEAAIYLALLELGEATASDIAKKAKLKRTTAYNLLPSFEQQGYIRSIKKRDITHYYIEDIKKIEQRQVQKLETIKNMLPELAAIHNILPQKPKITTHEGLAGFLDIYDDVINNSIAGEPILSYAGTRNVFDYVPKKILEDYMRERINKKLPLKIITNRTQLSESLSANQDKNLREVKFIEGNSFNFLGETIIYNGKVGIISYKEDFLGIIIESKEIYAMHKAAFMSLWERI